MEVNSKRWSSERSVRGASPPSIRKMGTFTMANSIITATTVDARLSSVASNTSSQRTSVGSLHACCSIGANLTQHHQCRALLDPFDGCQVDADHVVQPLPYVAGHLVI